MSHNIDDVFGVVRDVPLNYVSRAAVDLLLINSLSRTKHIVIHGGSKQGKTCLRKHCLDDDDYIVVQCSNRWAVGDINANILKRAGFEVTQSTERSVSGKQKIIAKFSAALLGVGLGTDGELERGTEEKKTLSPLTLDADDVNDLIAALDSINFRKFIVLEDFHYLSPETQRDFAIELKALHEVSSLSVIVVGVWLEENRLIVYNGDLTGRVIPINADLWSKDDLLAVVDEGEKLLNISFDRAFIDELLDKCFESVSIVQECCRRACRDAGIFTTQENRTPVAVIKPVDDLVREVVNEQRGRYRAFLTNFADGFQDTRLEMYRWLLWPILTADSKQLESGLTYAEIRKSLQQHHPSGGELNPGNITQALQSAASLQVDKNIKPIIIDYDSTTRRLSVVDRGFLIWLASQARQEVLECAGLPSQEA
jgi:hypothetical protein